ncbi:MAG: hypothetical protein K2H41_15070 [Acetatifactor sp.]|nr:hypothetical protein [Acetatifactor sp.]
MTEAGAIYIYMGFVSVCFMLVGILGICKQIKFLKRAENLRELIGVVVDYSTSWHREDGDGMSTWKYYAPIYEYEWGGVRKQLTGPVGHGPGRKSKIGAQVHILLDPQTEKAICREDETHFHIIMMILGVIGLLAFVLVLLRGIGIL